MTSRPKTQERLSELQKTSDSLPGEESGALPVQVTLRDIKSVILLLQSTDDDVISNACKAVRSFINDEDSSPSAQAKSLVEGGALTALVERCSFTEEYETMELTNEETGEPKSEKRPVYKLVHSEACVAHCMELLEYIVTLSEDIGLTLVKDLNIEQTLSFGLRWAMQNSVSYPDPRPGAVAEEEEEVSEPSRILRSLFAIVASLTSNDAVKGRLGDSTMVRSLLQWVARMDPPIVAAAEGDEAASVRPSTMTEESDAEEGAVRQELSSSDGETPQARAIGALASLTEVFPVLRSLLSVGAIETVVRCLRAYNPFVVERAAVIVERLAQLAGERAQLVRLNAVAPVAALVADVITVDLPKDDKAEKEAKKKKKPSSKGKGAPPPAEEEEASATTQIKVTRTARTAAVSTMAEFACESRGRKELMRAGFGRQLAFAVDLVLREIERKKETAEEAQTAAEGDKKKGKKKGRGQSAPTQNASVLPAALENLLSSAVVLAGRISSDDRGADYILSLSPQHVFTTAFLWCLKSSKRSLQRNAAEAMSLVFRAIVRDVSQSVESRFLASGLLEPILALLAQTPQPIVTVPTEKPESFAGSDEDWKKNVSEWKETQARVDSIVEETQSVNLASCLCLRVLSDSPAVRDSLRSLTVSTTLSAPDSAEKQDQLLGLVHGILESTLPPYDASKTVPAEEEPSLVSGGVSQRSIVHHRRNYALQSACLGLTETLVRDPDVRNSESRFVSVAAQCLDVPEELDAASASFARAARQAACSLLSVYAQDEMGRAAIVESNIIPKAISLLTDTDSENILVGALVLLKSALRGRREAEIAADHGALPLLRTLETKRPGESMASLAAAIISQIVEVDLSARLWWTGSLSFEQPLYDGFYDCGRDFMKEDPWLSRDEHKAVPLGTKWKETLVVDRSGDEGLQALIDTTAERLSNVADTDSAIRVVAEAVSEALGGSMATEDYANFSYIQEVDSIRVKQGTNFVPIGALKRGNARHRAVLFKALVDLLREKQQKTEATGEGEEEADAETTAPAWKDFLPKVNLCRTKIERGVLALFSWNEFVSEAGETRVIDLLHDVGSTYPCGSEKAKEYCREGGSAFSLLT